MHVDGGAAAQLFFYPPPLRVVESAHAQGLDRRRTLYIIRNSRLRADRAQVERRTMAVVMRAITSLIQTQGRGDLYRMYALAQRDGIDFNLACIPDDFNASHPADFDTAYMRQLFERGRTMAAHGYPWLKHPPDYALEAAAEPPATACGRDQHR